MSQILLDLSWRLLSKLPAYYSYKIVHGFPHNLQNIMSRVLPGDCPPSLDIPIMGQKIANPVGLAAGLNKDGNLTWLGDALCLGFTVVGSILPYPYRGAERKILMRPTPYSAINRLGLPSKGVEKVLSIIKSYVPKYTKIAYNIAGLKPGDYTILAEKIPADNLFVEINISCPNTEAHSSFEEPEEIGKLLKLLPGDHNYLLKIPNTRDKDLLIKYASLIEEHNLAGVVAGNTSKFFVKGVQSGLSGKPIYHNTLRMTRILREHLKDRHVIVSVGGVMDSNDAVQLLEEGANLIEILTVLLRRGPRETRNIISGVYYYLSKK